MSRALAHLSKVITLQVSFDSAVSFSHLYLGYGQQKSDKLSKAPKQDVAVPMDMDNRPAMTGRTRVGYVAPLTCVDAQRGILSY